MAEAADFFGVAAEQHRNQVRRAETLAGARRAGHRLLRGDAAVPGLRRVHAVVAVAACAVVGFAEVGEHHAPPAVGRFAKLQQRVNLALFHALEIFAGFRVLQHLPQHHDVLQAVAHPRARRQPVAAGAAGFLVIGLNVFRQVEVRDEAHIGLVYAHAEGDGRGHDHAVLAQKSCLVFFARVFVHAGVVGERAHAVGRQPFRGLVDVVARQAVDDAGFARVFFADKFQQRAARVSFLVNRVGDVRAVQAGGVLFRVAKRQALGDVAAGRLVRGRGQRDARHIGETLGENGKLNVFRAEVMPPARHAVRLVYREQREWNISEHGQRAVGQQPLGRDIQHVQISAAQIAHDSPLLVVGHA